MSALPIDPMLPDVVAAVRRGHLVLQAPPGAGKTTCVPRALLEAGLARQGRIVVLEPRRLAARLPARWVASELGESVGERVGYRVRFAEAVGAATRVEFMTEGILLRRLLHDPMLRDVAVVIFDEFHERHLDSDVGLAVLRRLQLESRPELRLVVMSATLDAAPIAHYLGDCPLLQATGRHYDVRISYDVQPDARALAVRVAAALRRWAAQDPTGSALVFLPGVGEIERCREAVGPWAAEHGYDLLPLHGSLPIEAQERAVAGKGPKIVLATNVAETSVTIDGITAVIDSGLARVPGVEPWSGLGSLRLQPISRASAAQRAGRAGRLGPGTCLRLYTQHDHDTRRPHTKPEIERLDLCEVVLLLRLCGLDPAMLPWLDAPPAAALHSAETLLMRLGATDGSGCLTDVGRKMGRFAVHPRLARLLVEACARGVGADAAVLSAIAAEPRLQHRDAPPLPSGPSDLLELADRVQAAWQGGSRVARQLGLRRQALRTVRKASEQLRRRVGRQAQRAEPAEHDVALRLAILAGYPDRVATVRQGGGERHGVRELLLASGRRARLDAASGVREADWLVALDAEERGRAGGRTTTVRLASAIEPEWLLDLFAEQVVERSERLWNAPAERVEMVGRLCYERLVLDETRRSDVRDPQVTALLYQQATAHGVASFDPDGGAQQWLVRAAVVRQAMPQLGVAEIGAEALEAALRHLCEGRGSFAELRQGRLVDMLRERVGGALAARIDTLAPERVTLASGRRARVRYEAGAPPAVAAFIQDFFGSLQAPRIVDGRVVLTVHLLAPNRRAVQVTTDLAGFWQKHYPRLRTALARRYPRHSWPEDPVHAQPEARPRPRQRRR